jgi:digeranylgeranylglycerophospholipid reductase
MVGGVSVCRPLDCTVGNGLILVGDAARVVDPLTGGGIYNSRFTGDLAAKVAAECIAKGDCSKKALMAYDKAWRASKMGKTIERNYRIKEYLIKLPDEKLNALIQSASKLDLKEFTTFSLVKEVLKHNPALFLELKHLIS